MNFTREELVDMVFILGECYKNGVLTARVYGERYPDRRHPRSFRKPESFGSDQSNSAIVLQDRP